jgi:hypothetical protein
MMAEEDQRRDKEALARLKDKANLAVLLGRSTHAKAE